MLVSLEFEPHERLHCFLKQETLPSLLSTGLLQERITALYIYISNNCLFRDQTKIN